MHSHASSRQHHRWLRHLTLAALGGVLGSGVQAGEASACSSARSTSLEAAIESAGPAFIGRLARHGLFDSTTPYIAVRVVESLSGGHAVGDIVRIYAGDGDTCDSADFNHLQEGDTYLFLPSARPRANLGAHFPDDVDEIYFLDAYSPTSAKLRNAELLASPPMTLSAARWRARRLGAWWAEHEVSRVVVNAQLSMTNGATARSFSTSAEARARAAGPVFALGRAGAQLDGDGRAAFVGELGVGLNLRVPELVYVVPELSVRMTDFEAPAVAVRPRLLVRSPLGADVSLLTSAGAEVVAAGDAPHVLSAGFGFSVWRLDALAGIDLPVASDEQPRFTALVGVHAFAL